MAVDVLVSTARALDTDTSLSIVEAFANRVSFVSLDPDAVLRYLNILQREGKLPPHCGVFQHLSIRDREGSSSKLFWDAAGTLQSEGWVFEDCEGDIVVNYEHLSRLIECTLGREVEGVITDSLRKYQVPDDLPDIPEECRHIDWEQVPRIDTYVSPVEYSYMYHCNESNYDSWEIDQGVGVLFW